MEVAGFRHIKKNHEGININDPVTFEKEFNNIVKEEAVRVMAAGECLGYVNRGLLPTFIMWINNHRIKNAWIEKMNGVPGRPALYVYVEICREKLANNNSF